MHAILKNAKAFTDLKVDSLSVHKKKKNANSFSKRK